MDRGQSACRFKERPFDFVRKTSLQISLVYIIIICVRSPGWHSLVVLMPWSLLDSMRTTVNLATMAAISFMCRHVVD